MRCTPIVFVTGVSTNMCGLGLPTNQHAVLVWVAGILDDWNDVCAFLCYV